MRCPAKSPQCRGPLSAGVYECSVKSRSSKQTTCRPVQNQQPVSAIIPLRVPPRFLCGTRGDGGSVADDRSGVRDLVWRAGIRAPLVCRWRRWPRSWIAWSVDNRHGATREVALRLHLCVRVAPRRARSCQPQRHCRCHGLDHLGAAHSARPLRARRGAFTASGSDSLLPSHSAPHLI